jgi:nicotinamide-nucleotide amidase
LDLTGLARRCGDELVRQRKRLACAESCTGGLIAATCTAVAGSSEWFEASFVTYRLEAKTRVLRVPVRTLRQHGPVSEATARAMAKGALDRCNAHVAVAVTGIAGPTGGDSAHPVGTVWFAWTVRSRRGIRTTCHHFTGSRDRIRRAAVATALGGVLAVLARR